MGVGGIVRASVSGVTSEAVTTSSGGGMLEAGACSGCGDGEEMQAYLSFGECHVDRT